jgi:hypothetical protein
MSDNQLALDRAVRRIVQAAWNFNSEVADVLKLDNP